MYFYCWVEICTNHADCAQHCTIICECVAVCFALYTAVLYGVLLICASPPAASEGERQRREVTSESNPVQLVSFGPLLLGHNDTELEDTPCVKQSTSKPHLAENYSSHVVGTLNVFLCSSVFQVTVYMLSGVGAGLLLILLFTAWSSIRKRQKPEAQQVCDAQVDRNRSQ